MGEPFRPQPPGAGSNALTTLDLFGQTDALRGNVGTGARLALQFADLTLHPRVRHARQRGVIFAWDVDSRLPDFARRYARHALAQGVLLRPIGHAVCAMPTKASTWPEAQVANATGLDRFLAGLAGRGLVVGLGAGI